MNNRSENDAFPQAQPDARKGVQSVEHGFKILQAMEKIGAPVTVTALSDACGMPPSRVHHYLVSLMRANVVQQNPDGRYDLGTFALHLGLSAIRRLDFIELGTRAAQRLRDESGQATFIAVWGSHGATIVRYFDGAKPVTVEIRAGLVMPLLTSATGQAFLTWGAPGLTSELAQHAEGASQDEIKKIKRLTEANGLAAVEGTLLPRISALSAPVFDRDNKMILALSTLGWVDDFDTNPEGETAIALKRAAQSLSRDLGCLK
ncbi:MAG: IclR family transcriptional regulator [Pseudomonadota bacterium]